ncbi:MAG: integrase/recombinase XerD, partial [Acidobacteriota bacterium]|nr:integrase/recombinase XerD [Acidobacteriota bacterium]
STVNRTLSAVTGFYEYQARNGSKVAKSLLVQTRSGQGGYKSFLAGIAPNRARGRVGRLAAPQRLPRTLTLTQVAAILAAQARFRDRLLFALMFETGMRIGQVLGLRHEDVITWEERIEIVPRDDNANRARGKGGYGSIPIARDLIQLHHEYMHREYGAIDSDYVFINLWGGTVGRPMNYASVVDIVDRTRAKVGFPFTCHMLRHTWATLAARDGVPIEVISNVLTHRSIETTSGTYIHRSAEDLRRALEAAGVYERVRDLV